MPERIARIASVFLVALCLSFAASAQTPKMGPDQSPATNAVDADYAKQQQERQITQPLNNQPVWSEARSGAPQFTSLPGRETNVLIQPEGQTWRALRNSQVAVYAGWALVVMVAVIAAFYFWKGTMQLHEPPTGRRIRRFTNWQMAIHWTTAYCFVTLAITGLIIVFGKNVLLPILGYTLFSWLAILAKNLHNFVGPLFFVCILLLFFTFVRDNFPRSYDLTWLRRFGGLFSGQDVPSGKFNAGEKVWFWGGLLFCGLIVSASGFLLDFPNFDQTRSTMQIANIIHLIIASLFMLAALGHIYMGTLGIGGGVQRDEQGLRRRDLGQGAPPVLVQRHQGGQDSDGARRCAGAAGGGASRDALTNRVRRRTMQTTIRALLGAALVVTVFGVAVAKLPPAPPLTEEQKPEKAAKAEKDKATADKAKAALMKAEDRVVSRYMADKKAKGVAVNPHLPTAQFGAPDSAGGKSPPTQPEKASNAHSPAKK